MKLNVRNLIARSSVFLAAVLAMMLFNHHPDSDRAVRIILGEAADQSFIGKIAVGEVIRRRGDFDGFSSEKKDLRAFYRQQPAKTRAQARLAWTLSRFTNFSAGADHFDNVKEFGEPEWAKSMRKTVKIDDTQYYRSRK